MWGSNSTKDTMIPVPGSTDEVLRPVPMLGGSEIRDVSFGKTHSAIVDGDGNVWTQGSNKYKQLGVDGDEVKEPTKISDLSGVSKIACGKRHTVALTEHGDLLSWGWGGSMFEAGALGHGDKELQLVPKKVEGLPDNLVDISCGHFSTFALTDTGDVWGWGRGEFGALGQGSSASYKHPALLDCLHGMKIVKVSCTSTFAAALTEDGVLFMWGRNDAQQLAQSESLLEFNNMEAVPCQIELFEEEDLAVKDVSCGDKHTTAVTEDGHVYIWGNNQWTQPFLVSGDDGFMLDNEILTCGAGNRYSAATDGDGYLFTWGQGSSCCLGRGDKENETNPTLVEGFGPDPHAEFGRVERVVCAHKQIAALVSKD